MKRLGHCWPSITAFENLYSAYRKARKGKQQRRSVARFSLDLERELLDLQQSLQDGSYRPGEYRQFTIYDRKPRVISAAPFRDRVVHHAVMNLIEPSLDRRFIDDCYACRKHKGVHAAVNRYQHYARRYAYVLKLDVRQYFPSIDHDILYGQLQARIKDRKLLNLLRTLIDHSPDPGGLSAYFPGDDLFTPLARRSGIPIGNLTSQFFANLYLDDTDHWLKETRSVPGYIRYVDDLMLFADDKAFLWETKTLLDSRLGQLRLRLHPNKVLLSPCREKRDVFGYQVAPEKRWLRNDNGIRFQRRLRQLTRTYADGNIAWPAIDASVQSWIGHARHGETWNLRERIFEKHIFTSTHCPH